MSRRFPLLLVAAAGSLLSTLAGAGERQNFAEEVANRHDLKAARVAALIEQAEHDARALERLRSPAEALPWHEYRALLLDEERIKAGLAYWANHEALLSDIAREHDVPASILVAILGIESHYGDQRGEHQVLDALTTLGFSEHPRAGFFRKELAHFLLLSSKKDWAPAEVRGSYAGAIGKPQFLPSSYAAYAVDHDGDGRRDLRRSAADALASAAHYLASHGWEEDGPIARRATAKGTAWRDAVSPTDRPVEPTHRVEELRAKGIQSAQALKPDRAAALITLSEPEGPQLWLTFQNFYALTRYNHSALYAMAVHQLAEELRQGYSP